MTQEEKLEKVNEILNDFIEKIAQRAEAADLENKPMDEGENKEQPSRENTALDR